MEGREWMELAKRAVLALERLAEDPQFEVETQPPVCPHCEQMNPTVFIHESEGSGPLAEFVVQATCRNCDKVFFAAPFQWAVVKSMDELEAVVEGRVNLGGFDGRTNQTG
jgi:hypothetical protein